jgi:hypothetical protein
VQFVEREPYCHRILAKHWPTVPIHDDICTFNPAPRSADIVCGGFPCQDISTAGKQAGIKQGTRSGLFYELMRVICVVRPRYVVLENVSAILANGLDTVLGELAEAGFDANGRAYLQVLWAPATSATVGGLLPTPRSCSAMAAPVSSPSTLARAADPNCPWHNLEIHIASHCLLPTPVARDWKGVGRADQLPTVLAPTGAATYLNPSFVEEMMGFPIGWTV